MEEANAEMGGPLEQRPRDASLPKERKRSSTGFDSAGDAGSERSPHQP
jgi:hypothetical protein